MPREGRPKQQCCLQNVEVTKRFSFEQGSTNKRPAGNPKQDVLVVKSNVMAISGKLNNFLLELLCLVVKIYVIFTYIIF